MIVVVAGVNGICWVGRLVELREAEEGIEIEMRRANVGIFEIEPILFIGLNTPVCIMT